MGCGPRRRRQGRGCPLNNPFSDLIKAARDLVFSAHMSGQDSHVPTEAVVRLRHAAARAATALAESPTPSEPSPSDGVAETTLGVTGAGDPSHAPLVSLGQGEYAHGLDAEGRAFPAFPRGSTFPIARTAEGQDVEVGPGGHIEPRA